MEQYVGLDVSLKETSICVVDGSGETVWQGEVSTRETLARSIRAHVCHLEASLRRVSGFRCLRAFYPKAPMTLVTTAAKVSNEQIVLNQA